MAVFLSPVYGVAGQLFNNNGDPLAGGKIYTYAAGTTTPAATYTNSIGNIAHTNPIILDSAGRVPSGEIWLTDGITYKFVIKDSNDVLIGTYDNIVGINSNFVNFTNEQEIQTATAGQTVFNLTTMQYQPGTNSLSVFVDGVNQYGPSAQYAYVETDNNTVTFVSGLHVGASVKFTTSQLNTSGAVDAQQVSYDPPFTGSVPTNVEAKLAQTVSVKDFGAVGDGSDEYSKILAAWNYCLANGTNLYFPAGTYSSGTNNMPFKNPTYPAVSLLDCGDITIYGDGPNTILRTDSVNGADVLNLYSVKNLHIRNMKVMASITGATSGSNGCSIVGGFDNITIENLWAEDLPYVDQTTYLDGGKGLTIQPGSPSTVCGSLSAKNIFVRGCVHGIGFDIDNDNWLSNPTAVRIEGIVEDCYEGVLWSGLPLTTPGADNGFTAGLVISATSVNCQHSAIFGRLYGAEIDVTVVNTKSAADRRLNPNGGAWASSDTVVDALVAHFVRNCKITAMGYAADCDYKVQIGGTNDSATNNSTFYINLGGPAALIADFNLISGGGNTANNSVFYVTTVTTSSIPTALYASALNNTVTLGSQLKLMSAVVQNTIGFAYTDGITSYTELARDGFGVFAKQTGGSSAFLAVLGAKNNAGTKVFFVRNDGSIATQGRGTASAVATVNGVLPIYDTSNVLIGYTPIYTNYTP